AISDRALQVLRAHQWVGNVRELRNVIERAVIVAVDETVRVEHLPDELRGQEIAMPGRPSAELATGARAESAHIATVAAMASVRGGLLRVRSPLAPLHGICGRTRGHAGERCQ